MITFDTSAIYALLNRRDPKHVVVKKIVLDERPPYLVPAGIMAEVCYLVEQRLGLHVLSAFLHDIEDGAFTLDCGDTRIGRVCELAERYGDLPLGFADASVIVCAEENGGRVLTLDKRDFSIVARDVPLQILP